MKKKNSCYSNVVLAALTLPSLAFAANFENALQDGGEKVAKEMKEVQSQQSKYKFTAYFIPISQGIPDPVTGEFPPCLSDNSSPCYTEVPVAGNQAAIKAIARVISTRIVKVKKGSKKTHVQFYDADWRLVDAVSVDAGGKVTDGLSRVSAFMDSIEILGNPPSGLVFLRVKIPIKLTDQTKGQYWILFSLSSYIR